MKSTKLLTNPYVDVTNTTTNVATSKLNKLINDHNNTQNHNHNHSHHHHYQHNHNSIQNNNTTTTTNNSNNSSSNNNKKKPRKPNANHLNDNNDINTSIVNGEINGDKTAVQLHSMSFNSYKSGGTNTDDFDDCTTTTTTATATTTATTATTPATPPKYMATNQMRSHNPGHVHNKRNGVIQRTSTNNKLHIGIGNVAPRTNNMTQRYTDSDDTRSSLIDYNFNYVKFRSPLNMVGKQTVAFRDSSPASQTSHALTFDSNTFARPMPSKCIETGDKRHSLILPKVHNHPSCQCSIQNLCPFAVAAAEHTLHPSCGNGFTMHEQKCYSPRHPYRRRDATTKATNYALHYGGDGGSGSGGKSYESPPEYDRIDDFLMKRTHSHDRLFGQRRGGNATSATATAAIRNSGRPKSYCSNVNHYPVQL